MLVGGGVEHDLGPVAPEQPSSTRRGRGCRPGRSTSRTPVELRARRRAGGSRRGRAARSAAGSNSATWRAISEPIEPPAPVTRTRRPRSSRPHRVEVGLDLLAPEQVLDPQVADVARRDPCRRRARCTDGSTRSGTPARSHRSATRRTSSLVARRDRQHDLVHAQPGDQPGRSAKSPPTTRTPGQRGRLRGSSSTIAHRLEPRARGSRDVGRTAAGLAGADHDITRSGCPRRSRGGTEEPSSGTGGPRTRWPRSPPSSTTDTTDGASSGLPAAHRQSRRPQPAREDDPAGLLDARVPPHLPVEPEQVAREEVRQEVETG